MSKQVNYNENLCSGAAIRDDKGRRISKLFEASHPKMTVGYAKNLIMPDDPTEQEFNFRQAGGGVIEDGVAVIDKVKGNSVVWNQQCKVASGSFTTNNLSVVASEGGVLINGTASPTAILSSVTSCPTARIVGHKYLLKGCPSGGSNGTYSFRYNSNGFGETGTGKIVTCVAAGTSVASDQMLETYVPVICIANGVECNNLLFRPRLIDLTQMFGAGNEPSTYEEFLSRKPKVAYEYAYNEGEIINNKIEAIKTTGINLWDEQWEIGVYRNDNGEKHDSTNRIRSKNPIACTPSTTYYAFYGKSTDHLYAFYYDENMKYITSSPYRVDNRTFTSPSNARFFTLGTYGAETTTYNHDICINLSDPSINGKYFPYEEHTLDLSWVKDIKDSEGVKLFEDGMRSVGTAFDEAAKGRAIKRIGVKVFDGTEDWALESINSYGIANFRTKGLSKILSAPLLSAKYPSQTTPIAETQTIGLFNANESSLYIRELSKDFASVDAWKAHLADLHAAGTPLVVCYGLDTPIEVEYDEKNLTYPVIAGGTEEAIASEPSTAFRADIGYGIDAVKTILDLKARVEALEGK